MSSSKKAKLKVKSKRRSGCGRGIIFLLCYAGGVVFLLFCCWHSFGGENIGFDAWLSLVATCVASVPGAFFGFLALVQTKTNFELERRYHRTYLSVDKADMEVKWFADKDYPVAYEDISLARIMTDKIGKDEQVGAGFISFHLAFKLENEIEPKGFDIKELAFRFGMNKNAKTYVFKVLDPGKDEGFIADYIFNHFRTFDRDIENGHRIYKVDFALYPYEIVPLSSQQYDSPKKVESEFWRDLRSFMNWDYLQDPVYSKIQTVLKADIHYEYAPVGSEEIAACLVWSGEPHNSEDKNSISQRHTTNAYLTYDGPDAG